MTEDLARIRAEALVVPQGIQLSGVPTRLDAWSRKNPNAFATWTTKRGGCVVAFWGMKIYYGPCRDCSGLVTARRAADINGRWPERCPPCRGAKADKRADNARARMARLRRDRYAFRDEQYARAGLPPVRQGVSAELDEPEDVDLDDLDFCSD